MDQVEPKDVATRKRILDWAAPCFPLEVREEAVQVHADFLKGKPSEAVDFYSTELQFGTGGLRGVIGNGAGRMNPWTVGRATLGFARWLKGRHKKASIVIAHDSRRMSRQFAETTAGVAAGLGLNVFLFEGVTPTPVLSYAIRRLKASGGVVITASHNPPEYNGYKVYLSDGGQLVGPPQNEIEAAIAAIHDWGDIAFHAPDDPIYVERVRRIGPEIKKAYIAEFKNVDFVSPAANPAKKGIRIVYSPLHGTGGPWLPDLLAAYGFDVHLVEEQKEPNGEFPTVRFPNPEEREALRLAEETARRMQADMFLATDPDADRLGAGLRTADGDYVVFDGNQIGSMMCAYLCERLAGGRKGRSGSSGKNHFVFKTIVTTNLQAEIARKNGVAIKSVLTGFKYIAEQMGLLEAGDRAAGYKKGRDIYLFGGEESFGYLPVDFVRDKDSLASALLLAEMLASEKDLVAYLAQIHLKYGLYLEDLKSVTMKGAAGLRKINEIIENLRSSDLVGWTLGARTVKSVLDYRAQTRDGRKSAKDFDGYPTSNVLQLVLEPEGLLTIRPSGTEPKVKLYASLRHPNQPSSLDELELSKKELQNELASLSGSFFARAGLTG